MKKILAIVIAVSLLASSAMLETVPLKVSYQGLLKDAAGMPVTGTVDIIVRIYDTPTGGTPLYTEQFTELVSAGVLDLILGESQSLDPVYEAAGRVPGWDLSEFRMWMEVEVEGFAIAPRQRLMSSPYSLGASRMLGDIFTSPGHLYMVPNGPPVSDCTYVPLEMAVDSTASRLRMKSFTTVGEFHYVGIDMETSFSGARINLKPPIPVSDCTYVPLQLSTDAAESKISLRPPNPNIGSSIELNTGAVGSGPSMVIVQPGPISKQVGEPMEITMVQIGPGPVQDPMLTLNATPSSGSSLVMLNPQPLPPNAAERWLSLSTDATMGASLEMFNSEANPGPLQVPAVQINGGSAIIDPNLKLMDTKTGPAGEMKTSNAELTVNGNMESMLGLHHNGDAGIDPCIKVVSGISGAHVNIVANHPPDPGKSSGLPRQAASSSDSAYINMIADTNSARIEVFGRAAGGAGSPPAVFIKADNSGGKVGINTVNPTEALHVVGNICATGTIGGCSDERYKKNVETITNALALIEKMRGVNFKWRTYEFPDKKFFDARQVGFIAQELKEVLPELVSQGSDGFYSVDYSRLTPVLVEAVKEQQRTIETLNQRLERLEKRVKILASAEVKR